MRYILLPFLILLAACSGDGRPSENEIEEYLYGVFLKDAEITHMALCSVPDDMMENGHSNVWMVWYRFEGSDNISQRPFTRIDGEWTLYPGVVLDYEE
jgi:hypothetical protein